MKSTVMLTVSDDGVRLQCYQILNLCCSWPFGVSHCINLLRYRLVGKMDFGLSDGLRTNQEAVPCTVGPMRLYCLNTMCNN